MSKKINKWIAERPLEAGDYKEYMVTIEPMYVGKKEDLRKERVMTIRKLDPLTKKFNEFQAIVPKRSRLDQEVDKILEALTKQQNEQEKGNKEAGEKGSGK